MRAVDWSGSPLGAIDSWPAPLKTAVRILLDCQLPMYLAWGPRHIQFYNDAYLPILGDKQALALGNSAPETWSEIWPTIGPMWADVMQGRPIGADDFKLTINRFGYMEDCYFSFSYSPVPDENGEAGGILVTFAETTKKVLAERRQAFQLRLADSLRDQPGANELIESASRLAGEHFGVGRTGYAEIDPLRQTVSVERDWTAPGFLSLAGETRPLDSFGPALIDELHQGRTLVIDDVDSDARSQPYAAGYASIGVRSIAAVPLRDGKVLKGIFYLHVGAPRHWTQEEVALAEEVARRIADAVQRVRVEEQLREETGILELLNQTGQSLNSTLQFDALLQSITDAATKLAGADFGAFFYNACGPDGDTLTLYTLSGAPREAFERFGHPRATPVFRPTFHGQAPIRSDDITRDPRYGQFAPHHGMPKGHLPVVSYLAVSVVSKSGEVLGGLFFGHSQRAKFTDRTERLIEGIAAQAATSIDNARLYETAQRAAEERETLLNSERTARAEAERLGRAKDEFLAMLAHELRNPLAPVSAAADVLRLDGLDAGRIRRASDVITRQVGHLTHLINDLMDVSRVTRGLVGLNKEYLDVRNLVASAVEQIKPLIEARRHRLEVRLGAGQADVFGDRTRLVQVIANLLNNAAKYTPPGGDIALDIEVEAGRIEIAVSDNGSGIDSALLPHVFELFTQGSRSLDRTQGGLGIGLALVKAIVALHDGAVHADSAGVSRGSRFTVSLPQAADQRLPAATQAAVSAGMALDIMIVDDNTDAAESLGVLLGALGHQVAVEFNAASAIAQAGRRARQAFILDIGLPDMSGYELAAQLRQVPGCEGATLIALTGYGQDQDRAMALAAGFDHHMVKPADTQRLLKLLAGIGAAL